MKFSLAALTAPTDQTVKFMLSNVAYRATLYKTGALLVKKTSNNCVNNKTHASLLLLYNLAFYCCIACNTYSNLVCGWALTVSISKLSLSQFYVGDMYLLKGLHF